MLALILLGFLMLCSLIFYGLKWGSRRSTSADRATERILQVVLGISLLVLIVQDYALKDLPHNGVVIATLIAVYMATLIPDRAITSSEPKRPTEHPVDLSNYL